MCLTEQIEQDRSVGHVLKEILVPISLFFDKGSYTNIEKISITHGLCKNTISTASQNIEDTYIQIIINK